MTHTPTGPYGPPMQPGPSPQQPEPSRPWFKKKRYVIPAALVVLAGIGGALSDGDETADTMAAGSTTTAQASVQSPEATAEPANPPSSTAPAPAESTTAASDPAEPSPTAAEPTVEETSQPEETPEPEPELDPYVIRYGSFDAMTQSGTGDSVVELPEGIEAGLITATHDGSRNFVIQGIDEDFEMVDLYVNEIGSYAGTVDWGLTSYRDAPTTLQITADGAWTVTLSPITSAPDQGTAISGTGDAVVKYEGAGGFAPISHDGESNFVVYQTDGTRPNLLVNEIGSYSGTIPVKAGPSLLVIKADGNWSITVE